MNIYIFDNNNLKSISKMLESSISALNSMDKDSVAHDYRQNLIFALQQIHILINGTYIKARVNGRVKQQRKKPKQLSQIYDELPSSNKREQLLGPEEPVLPLESTTLSVLQKIRDNTDYTKQLFSFWYDCLFFPLLKINTNEDFLKKVNAKAELLRKYLLSEQGKYIPNLKNFTTSKPSYFKLIIEAVFGSEQVIPQEKIKAIQILDSNLIQPLLTMIAADKATYTSGRAGLPIIARKAYSLSGTISHLINFDLLKLSPAEVEKYRKLITNKLSAKDGLVVDTHTAEDGTETDEEFFDAEEEPNPEPADLETDDNDQSVLKAWYASVATTVSSWWYQTDREEAIAAVVIEQENHKLEIQTQSSKLEEYGKKISAQQDDLKQAELAQIKLQQKLKKVQEDKQKHIAHIQKHKAKKSGIGLSGFIGFALASSLSFFLTYELIHLGMLALGFSATVSFGVIGVVSFAFGLLGALAAIGAYTSVKAFLAHRNDPTKYSFKMDNESSNDAVDLSTSLAITRGQSVVTETDNGRIETGTPQHDTTVTAGVTTGKKPFNPA